MNIYARMVNRKPTCVCVIIWHFVMSLQPPSLSLPNHVYYGVKLVIQKTEQNRNAQNSAWLLGYEGEALVAAVNKIRVPTHYLVASPWNLPLTKCM
jgi:hypothetical protein